MVPPGAPKQPVTQPLSLVRLGRRAQHRIGPGPLAVRFLPGLVKCRHGELGGGPGCSAHADHRHPAHSHPLAAGDPKHWRGWGDRLPLDHQQRLLPGRSQRAGNVDSFHRLPPRRRRCSFPCSARPTGSFSRLTRRPRVSWTFDPLFGYAQPGLATVRSLALTNIGSTPQAFAWDGRSDAGVAMPPGWYTVRLTLQDQLGRTNFTTPFSANRQPVRPRPTCWQTKRAGRRTRTRADIG